MMKDIQKQILQYKPKESKPCKNKGQWNENVESGQHLLPAPHCVMDKRLHTSCFGDYVCYVQGCILLARSH
jgi:hypothetical protein